MNFQYEIRPCQAEQVVIALQRLLMRGKTLAPEIFFIQFQILDHRSHGAIKNENPLGQKVFKLSDCVRIPEGNRTHDLTADSDNIEKLGVRFSIADSAQLLTRNPASLQ